MSFPDHPFPEIGAYLEAYTAQVARALGGVPHADLAAAADILRRALAADSQVYSCGNGGSAAISNHLVCDHAKGICTDTGLRPRVHSLSATVEMLTAIANDLDYAEVFSYQLGLLGRPGDVLVTISSSGNSENVTRAILKAREIGMKSIALTGFDGGRTRQLADVALHVEADNYGVVEDCHQALMHVLAQYLRMAHMPGDLVASRRF